MVKLEGLQDLKLDILQKIKNIEIPGN